MYKKFLVLFAFVIISLFSALSFSACSMALFIPYNHQEGMTILLMEDSSNFRTQFHFLVVLEEDTQRARINEMDNFFRTLLSTNFGAAWTMPSNQGTQPEIPLIVEEGTRWLFAYDLTRPREAAERSYRFDPAFTSVLYANDDAAAFIMTRTTQHSNPFDNTQIINAAKELLNNPVSPFYEDVIAINSLMALARNRTDIEDGRRIAHNAVFYAEFRGEVNGKAGADYQPVFSIISQMQTSFSLMIMWHWFLLGGGIVLVMMVLMMVLSKKRAGKLVKVNRVVANRFGRIVTLDAAGMPVNEGAVFDELGGAGMNGAGDKASKADDVFDGF